MQGPGDKNYDHITDPEQEIRNAKTDLTSRDRRRLLGLRSLGQGVP